MRTISAELTQALAEGKGDIFRVKTWNDIDDYNSNPNTPQNTWDLINYDLFSTSAKCTLATENNYQLSNFTVFLIERGATINGVEHTVPSGLFFIEEYIENFGTIEITGSSYPNQKISLPNGDDTYLNVINDFCAAIGKTAQFRNPDDNWLNYQFFPAGKQILLNKAKYFENLLKQKYTILVHEPEPKVLEFFTLNSYKPIIFQDVCWSPELNLFCTISNTNNTANANPLISSNGTDWETITIPAKNWISITWSPELGIFCAVGSNGIITSPDGRTWTERTLPDPLILNHICWSPELTLFVATGYLTTIPQQTNKILTSPDGINWTTRTGAINGIRYSVTWSPELAIFCAVNIDHANKIETSPDGINWTAQIAPSGLWTDVCWSPTLGLFCAVNSNPQQENLITSPDGINWTAQTTPSNTWNKIIWIPELAIFCAVGRSIITSPDGINWTETTLTDYEFMSGIAWSPELTLACITHFNNDNPTNLALFTSPDISNWTQQAVKNNHTLTYLDGEFSEIVRNQSEVHYLYKDSAGSIYVSGDTTKPQWNLGFLEGTPPNIAKDPYYKYIIHKSPVRLDITDGDKIKFVPQWSIDPTKTIDAMATISEHFNPTKSHWYQNIQSIILFDKVEGGALPSTIERISNYTPLNTSNFDTILGTSDNNLQAAMDTLDDHTHTPASIGALQENGWIEISATWTRTGNHTFTISGDVTTTYRKGTKVRYKDGGAYEYGVVQTSSYSAPNTTVILITNSDYAMAAATITNMAISHLENPEDFPIAFNYTVTMTADIGSPTTTTAVGAWKVIGNRIFIDVTCTITNTGTASGGMIFSIPFTVTSAAAYGQEVNSTAKHVTGNFNINIRVFFYDANTLWVNGYIVRASANSGW